MSADDQDALWKAVSTLPVIDGSTSRSERVRLHCRRTLERRLQREPLRVEPITVGTICFVYAWHILRVVIR